MMNDEALADLVKDIKTNELRVPTIWDANGILQDGRNRLKTCQTASVESVLQGDGVPVKECFVGVGDRPGGQIFRAAE